MIALPPGVTINHEVTMVLTAMPEEFLTWYVEVGGEVSYTSYYDHRGQEKTTPVVKYQLGRASHLMATDQVEYIIRFRAENAGMALMLLMKFDQLVKSHNIKEVEQYVY